MNIAIKVLIAIISINRMECNKIFVVWLSKKMHFITIGWEPGEPPFPAAGGWGQENVLQMKVHAFFFLLAWKN